MNEQAYAQLWRAEVADLQPLEMAVAGGHMATDLAQVFVAGYQAAIRATFRVNDKGWVAYVVSEDRTPSQRHLAVTYNTKSATISGVKTWVAALENIASLLVKAGQGEDACYFLLPVEANGIQLKSRLPGQFLAGLSQGSVEFRRTVVQPQQHLDGSTARQFRFLEPLYLYVAFLAFIKSRWTDSRQVDELLSLAAILASADFASAVTAQQFAVLDQGVQGCMRLLDAQPLSGLPSWAVDRRLMEMYSKGIQQRAQRFSAE